MKKVVLLSMAAFVTIVIGIIAWAFISPFLNSQSEHRDTEQFIEEKYGIDVEIISTPERDPFVGDSGYRMAPKGREELVFTVEVSVENYATIYRDDYKVVLGTYEARQQVEELMPQIEALGFSAPADREMMSHILKDIRTNEAVRWLVLETETNYETLELAEVEPVKQLLDLQQENGIDINRISLVSKQVEAGFTLELPELDKEDQNVEELHAFIIRKNPYLVDEEMITNSQDAATQAKTDRFRFFNEKDDHWMTCQKVNARSKCISLRATVTFNEGQLSKQNPYLKEDLEAIFGFFEVMEPAPVNVDLLLTDAAWEKDPIYLSSSERESYASTEELIDELLRE
ncbi:hypothetical protein FQV26_04180 [Planococcus sp. CPCC 101016]|uniref:hypothetical protein n=1 Tax=Planococcus sp. CPCC 101016 TaxID=2599617 RepID=UPI0011B5B7CC|nr:hypothetical protein [Planococcus sp. CPCC 101016]TWT07018.1 hypothetical protein FQV26_04180 [Planococcus sp. CPCC 101016]